MRRGLLILLRIVLFPISLALGFIVSVLSFLLGLGTVVFKIFSIFFILAVIATLYYKNYKMTIEALILAYLANMDCQLSDIR